MDKRPEKRDPLSEIGRKMLDDPAWIRGFIWFLVFCTVGLIVTQVAIKLGWIQ